MAGENSAGARAIRHVVVAGAGLAGLAAAEALVRRGMQVTLLEQKSIPGGRASSYEAQGAPGMVDNCQHILLGCCVNLREFYRRTGVDDRISWTRSIRFQEAGGRVSVLSSARLPAPFHVLPSFLLLKFLTPGEKWSIARALMLMLLSTGPRPDCSFSEWLDERGQPRRAVERFWRPIIVSALNEEPERCSARYAFQIFRQGFLGHRNASALGSPRVPLRELYGPCVDALRRAGADVRFRSAVRAIQVRDGRVCGVAAGDGTVEADAVIVALNFDRAADLMEPHLGSRAVEPWRRLQPSPITGVHLWWDRPVMPHENLALLDREVQWIFNKNGDADGAGGAHVGLVVSASREWMPLSRAEILERCEREMREALPAAREGRITSAAVLKEAKATYSPAPGVDELRPEPSVGLPNLWLAGDWVRNGWPATMEAAVRSGWIAAEHCLEAAGRPESLLAPDLPWQPIVGRPARNSTL